MVVFPVFLCSKRIFFFLIDVIVVIILALACSKLGIAPTSFKFVQVVNLYSFK